LVSAAEVLAEAGASASVLPARPRVCASQRRRDEIGFTKEIILSQAVGWTLIGLQTSRPAAGMGIIGVASPTLIQRTPTMAFSIESTVGDLLDNPGPRAVLDKIMPQLATNPQIDMARGMSLKMVAGFSGGKITDALLAEVDAALAKL
jgi:hypothetical protein